MIKKIYLPECGGILYFARVLLSLLKINKCPVRVQTFSTHTLY
jgi:hypothetical protein